jgi:hypothetical protein
VLRRIKSLLFGKGSYELLAVVEQVALVEEPDALIWGVRSLDSTPYIHFMP